MSLQQVRKELKLYNSDLRNIEKRKIQCAFNNLAFIVQTKFKYDYLHISGHSVCINETSLIDPTCGCAWFYTGDYVNLVKNILKNKTKPNLFTDWFDQKTYDFWWNYAKKYHRIKQRDELPPNWDIPITILRGSFKGDNLTSIGKFSEYV